MVIRTERQQNLLNSVVNNASNGLQTAIDANRTENALAFLKTGDMINRPLPNGELPFHYAVRLGKFELVEKILKEFNPAIDKKDSQGLTAVDHAMIGNDPKMIALVLGYQIGQGFDAAFCKTMNASQIFHLELMAHDVQELRSESFFKSVPKLHQAASKGNLEEVKTLINEKDPNPYDAYSMTPLHHAVLAGKKDVAEWLLNQGGAKADIVTKSGRTLLHLASIGGHTDLISYLIDVQKMDTNKTDLKGNRPLHYAMALEDLSAAKALIQKGASPVLPSEPPPRQFLLESQTATPIDALIYFMKERSDTRDPLALTRFHYYAFTAIALSWLLEGDPILANFLTYILAYTNCESTRSRVAFLLSIIGIPHIASASHHDRGVLFLKTLSREELMQRPLWNQGINKQGESMPRWKLGLWLGYADAATCFMIAKGALKSLSGAWKQRTYETFRPLRNLVINTTISAFAIKNVVEKISLINEINQIFNGWDLYMDVKGDSFQRSGFSQKIGYMDEFWRKYKRSNATDWSNPPRPDPQGGSWTVDPFCNGKTESECILETDKEFNFASLKCSSRAGFVNCKNADGKGFSKQRVDARIAAMFARIDPNLKDGYSDRDAKKAIRKGLLKYHPDKNRAHCTNGCTDEQLKEIENQSRILSIAGSIWQA